MIKFRGKRKDNGEWVDGDLYQYAKRKLIIPYSDDRLNFQEIFDSVEVIPASIGMFTGLPDKNGKEIYGSIPINGEMSKGGDVVKIPDDYDKYGQFAGEEREVIFAYGGFRLKPKWDKSAKGNWLEDDECFEVIAPIYEKEQTDNPRIIDDGYPFTNLKPTYEKGETE